MRKQLQIPNPPRRVDSPVPGPQDSQSDLSRLGSALPQRTAANDAAPRPDCRITRFLDNLPPDHGLSDAKLMLQLGQSPVCRPVDTAHGRPKKMGRPANVFPEPILYWISRRITLIGRRSDLGFEEKWNHLKICAQTDPDAPEEVRGYLTGRTLYNAQNGAMQQHPDIKRFPFDARRYGGTATLSSTIIIPGLSPKPQEPWSPWNNPDPEDPDEY